MTYTQDEMVQLKELKQTIISSHSPCDGHGWLKYNTPCECLGVFRFIKRLYLASIPRKYWPLKLSELTIPSKYKTLIRTFLKNYKNALDKGLGFAFLGPIGVGKTALMVEILKFFIIKGYYVKYTTIAKALNEMPSTWDTMGDNPFIQYDIIAFDELDKVYIKDNSVYIQQKIENMIRTLLNLNKIVILGSNWKEQAIEDVFGNMFLSLVKRYLLIVTFSGEDLSISAQEEWLSELESSFDFFHKNILFYASKMDGR